MFSEPLSGGRRVGGNGRQSPQPPSAHSSSMGYRDTSSPFRPPLDLATLSSRNSPVPAMDLHAALNNIPKSFNFTHPSVLSNITSPPAVPPASSKYWDIPPPTFSPSLSRASSPKTSSVLSTAISSLSAASASSSQYEAATNPNHVGQMAALAQSSKYSQLLLVLEEMGKDIRPSYAGSKSSAERLKRGIIHARLLVREALLEVERASKQ